MGPSDSAETAGVERFDQPDSRERFPGLDTTESLDSAFSEASGVYVNPRDRESDKIMALTLVEAAKLMADDGQTLRAGVIAMFARASDILRVLPMKDITGNAYAYNREGTLPSVAFRGVNESYTPSTGIINPLTEALRLCGGDLDVDKFILKTGGNGVRSTHEELKIKALAAEVTRVIVKGDSSTEPREFDGLQNRITGTQLIANGATNIGDPLSLGNLDQLIDSVSGLTHLLMNKAMRRRLTVAARTPAVGGQIDYTIDEFGKRITMYAGIPIIVAYSDDGGTDPIAFDELSATPPNVVSTSIYGLALGDGLVSGLQNGIMDVRDLGEIDDSPVARTRVEWYPGLCIEHGRAAGRLYGISDAVAVV